MLTNLLTTQHSQLEALARAWLSAGATMFGVWDGDQRLMRWPETGPDMAATLAAPICIEDVTIGELRVGGLEDAHLHTRLVADAALIEHLVTLEQELQSMTADLVSNQDRLVALYKLTQSMRRLVTIDETLRCLALEARRLVKAAAGFAIYAGAETPLLVQESEGLVDEALIWQVYWQSHASERELLLLPDTADGALPSGFTGLFFIPIRMRGAIVAGVGLLTNAPSGFNTSHLKLARAIVEQGTAQLENVLLYQETFEQAKLQTEMDLARRVQLRLLPQRLPSVAGLDIYATSRPASQVGGDFYDFVQQINRPFIFSIGDVTGKGLSAALLMTMTRTAIHSKANFMPKPTPEVVMRNSNADLYDDFTQVGMFATAFIGQYLADCQKLLYANAGHSPVIYRPAKGGATLLQADSTPMGVLGVSLCKNHAISLGPGDLLIAATDGFSDARNSSDEMFGYERLLRTTEELADRSAREIADALFDAVDRFGNGRPQDDDQTLVVIKGAAM